MISVNPNFSRTIFLGQDTNARWSLLQSQNISSSTSRYACCMAFLTTLTAWRQPLFRREAFQDVTSLLQLAAHKCHTHPSFVRLTLITGLILHPTSAISCEIRGCMAFPGMLKMGSPHPGSALFLKSAPQLQPGDPHRPLQSGFARPRRSPSLSRPGARRST